MSEENNTPEDDSTLITISFLLSVISGVATGYTCDHMLHKPMLTGVTIGIIAVIVTAFLWFGLLSWVSEKISS